MFRTFLILILLFGIIVLFFFYARPAWTDFQTLKQERQDLKDINEEMDALLTKQDDLTRLINTIPRSDLERLDTAIPTEAATQDLLVSLEQFALRNGILLKKVDFTDAAEAQQRQSGARSGQPLPGRISIPTSATAQQLSEVKFAIEIDGAYESFKKFLLDLESNLRIIDVHDISFTGGTNADEALTFSISATTYYQVP